LQITLTDIERESYKTSVIHRIDGRIKIIITLIIILYAVSLPRFGIISIEKLALLESYLILLILAARLNLVYVIVRYLAVLPFGFSIAVFQLVIRQPFISEFTILYTLPFGVTVTLEGTIIGMIIFSKFTVAVTSVILLSSSTRTQDLVNSARRLGLPSILTMLLSMMVRYLYIFWGTFKKIRNAQSARIFSIRNRRVSRIWILKQIGYTICLLFVRSYEQGERTYLSMLTRGYTNDTGVFVKKRNFNSSDAALIVLTLIVIAYVEIHSNMAIGMVLS
jgi:cobalt/nickel transport system permease protein